jgi:hypothetical protein
MAARKFFYVCAGLFLLALSYHFGAGTVRAQVPSAEEVVVLTGTLQEDEIIPLPVYKDGTTALESECKWMVGVAYVNPIRFTGNDAIRCETVGRTLSWLTPDDPLDRSRAHYIIIAVRGSSPTAAQQQSWGQLKARFK